MKTMYIIRAALLQ